MVYPCTCEKGMFPNKGPCCASNVHLKFPRTINLSCVISRADSRFKYLLHPNWSLDCTIQCHSTATSVTLALCSTRDAHVVHVDFDNNCVYRFPLFQDDGVFFPRGHVAIFHSMVDTKHLSLYSSTALGTLVRLPMNCWNKFLRNNK